MASKAPFLAPAQTLEFDSLPDMREHFRACRFARLPVPGLIQRYVAYGATDCGRDMVVFASTTGRVNTETNTVRVGLSAERLA